MFTIGDKVMCVDNKNINRYSTPCPLKINAVYIIQAIDKCSCGRISFDIGLSLPSDLDGTVCQCNESTISNIWWFKSTRFVKQKEETRVNYVKLEIEIEEPILN